MKRKASFLIYLFSVIGLCLIFAAGCKKDNDNNSSSNNPPVNTVNDIDGNVYHTITIGTQVWMVENLKTTRYRDGSNIPNVTNNAQWSNLTTGAYCDYDNNSANSAIYGRLYNWYAVSDTHNICPAGWHVPTLAEWTSLIDYLGGIGAAGGKMKEAGLLHWSSPNEGATNESGFTALPSGTRYLNGAFGLLGLRSRFWYSSEYNTTSAWLSEMTYTKDSITIGFNLKTYGFSIRCVKD